MMLFVRIFLETRALNWQDKSIFLIWTCCISEQKGFCCIRWAGSTKLIFTMLLLYVVIPKRLIGKATTKTLQNTYNSLQVPTEIININANNFYPAPFVFLSWYSKPARSLTWYNFAIEMWSSPVQVVWNTDRQKISKTCRNEVKLYDCFSQYIFISHFLFLTLPVGFRLGFRVILKCHRELTF